MVLSLLYFTIKIHIVHVVLIVLIFVATEKVQEEIKRRERCMSYPWVEILVGK